MLRKSLVFSLVLLLVPLAVEAKPGRSYSSGRSSFSPSKSSFSSSSRSSSPRPSPSPSKSYTSGSGRTYSSSPSAPTPASSGSGKSYSSGSSSGKAPSSSAVPAKFSSSPSPRSGGGSSGGSSFSFDTGAARAQKEAASKSDFSAWKQEQSSSATRSSARDSSSVPPVLPQSSGTSRTYTEPSRRPPPFIPDSQTYRTRTVRIEHHYAPYYSRPSVTFNDPFGSLFWWWLLDRSLNERALWAYHRRSDMDQGRYQALLASDTNLEGRIKQLEAQQTPVKTNYVPQSLDPDLMYSDQHVHRAYATRPTASGRILFWLVFVPMMVAMAWFLFWLVFFKRWQTAR